MVLKTILANIENVASANRLFLHCSPGMYNQDDSVGCSGVRKIAYIVLEFNKVFDNAYPKQKE